MAFDDEDDTTHPMGFMAHALRKPAKPAVVFGDHVLTYADLGERSSRLAHHLGTLGTKQGGVVAAMLPNGTEFFEVACASARAEARFLPVNWHLKGEELAWILADSGASVLVADASLAEHVDRARSKAPECQVLMVGDTGTEGYENAIAGSPQSGRDGWATPAFMFYTSGTTGRPKGVVHGNVDMGRLEMAQAGLMALWGVTGKDSYLLTGPGYHAGPGGYAFTTLYAGGTVAALPHFDAREWMAAVARHRATFTFMAPAHFIRILEVPEEERAAYDLSSLRLVIHAGAPCPVPVKRRIMEALPDTEVWELYGMSEGGATRVSPEEWLERPGTVGKPWPGVEVRILDPETGEALPTGEAGVIYVKPQAPFVYHNDEAKTAEAWREDAFTVGDVGYLDGDGYLYLTDRATDMVIRGGVNVYPREIEDVLHDHPDVVDCAVFGVPDDRLGERIKAVVEVRPGSSVSPDDLAAHVQAHLADFKVPEIVELVDELSRDPNGKVLKRHLREEHWKAHGSAI